MTKREGYYDYMLRRTKEENNNEQSIINVDQFNNKGQKHEEEISKEDAIQFDGTYDEPKFTDDLDEDNPLTSSVYKREIKVLNESYYKALIRIKELNEEVKKLKDKVEVLENANLHNN